MIGKVLPDVQRRTSMNWTEGSRSHLRRFEAVRLLTMLVLSAIIAAAGVLRLHGHRDRRQRSSPLVDADHAEWAEHRQNLTPGGAHSGPFRVVRRAARILIGACSP